MTSTFNRIKDGSQLKPSIFIRIKTVEKPSNCMVQLEKSYAFSRIGVINQVQNSIPSGIRYLSTLDVQTNGSLRLKRHIKVFTCQQKSFNSNEEMEKEQVASNNHITIREYDDPSSKIELTETPETLEG